MNQKLSMVAINIGKMWDFGAQKSDSNTHHPNTETWTRNNTFKQVDKVNPSKTMWWIGRTGKTCLDTNNRGNIVALLPNCNRKGDLCHSKIPHLTWSVMFITAKNLVLRRTMIDSEESARPMTSGWRMKVSLMLLHRAQMPSLCTLDTQEGPEHQGRRGSRRAQKEAYHIRSSRRSRNRRKTANSSRKYSVVRSRSVNWRSNRAATRRCLNLYKLFRKQECPAYRPRIFSQKSLSNTIRTI